MGEWCNHSEGFLKAIWQTETIDPLHLDEGDWGWAQHFQPDNSFGPSCEPISNTDSLLDPMLSDNQCESAMFGSSPEADIVRRWARQYLLGVRRTVAAAQSAPATRARCTAGRDPVPPAADGAVGAGAGGPISILRRLMRKDDATAPHLDEWSPPPFSIVMTELSRPRCRVGHDIEPVTHDSEQD
jgi:hypothetical protein